jgi:hypothetical protein
MIALLAQAKEIVVPAQTMVETSPWSPALIGALFVGIIGIITALGKVLVDLKVAKVASTAAAAQAVIAVKTAEDTKNTVDKARLTGEEAGQARDKKLDEIKSLVDGKFSEVLDRVAKLTRAIANSSGRQEDIDDADQAQAAADKQREKVREAGQRTRHDDPPEVSK